jgi:hypothetical protein
VLEFDTVAADVTLLVTVALTELELLIVGETVMVFVTVAETELELLNVGLTVMVFETVLPASELEMDTDMVGVAVIEFDMLQLSDSLAEMESEA